MTKQPPFSDADIAQWDHCYAFLLIAGASLEAMIKAAALAAHMRVDGFARILSADGKLERWFTNHKLVELAGRAEMSVTDEEADELRRFQRYVEWAGSYPTPKSLREPNPNALPPFDFRVSNLDRVWFDRLYELAEETLVRHIEAARKTSKADPQS